MGGAGASLLVSVLCCLVTRRPDLGFARSPTGVSLVGRTLVHVLCPMGCCGDCTFGDKPSGGLCSMVSTGACPMGAGCCGVLCCDPGRGVVPLGVVGIAGVPFGVCGAEVLSVRSVIRSTLRFTG